MESERGLVVCVTGAECTGKTTLATALADALDAPLVLEAARAYLRGSSGYDADDVVAIARRQWQHEQQALEKGADVVVADTDLTVIQVWWEEKYGGSHHWVEQALSRRSPRRYLLMRPDLPWRFDPLRESPHDRERLHRRYRQLLEASPFPFAEIAGTGEVRLQRALSQVRRWLDERRG